jgi:hypothetical protein
MNREGCGVNGLRGCLEILSARPVRIFRIASRRMGRTILIAGGYPHQLPQAVSKAFAEKRWHTEFFDLSPESPWHRPLVKPVRKLIHGLRIQRHPETFDKTIISNLGWRSHQWWKRMRRIKPDAALLLRGNRIALPELKTAAAAGFPLFCWMLEPSSRLSSFLLEAEARVYREIFVYAESYLDVLKKAGAQGIYYPHRAMEAPEEARLLNRHRRYAWSFLGSHSPWREKILRAVLREFPNGFLAGPRWNRLKRDPLFGPVIHEVYCGQEECVALYLESGIGLDISSAPDPGASGLAMRVPELLACGCKVLLQASPEIKALPWDLGNRLLVYRTPEELLERMRREQAGAENETAAEEIVRVARSVVGHQDLAEQITRALEPT